MTYDNFRNIWFSALDYTADQRDLYIAERGWQTWMEEYSEDTQAIVDALDTIYAMAHGGCKAIRNITGLSQVRFATAYGIPRRTIENWDGGIESPAYVQMLLGYAVFQSRG